MAGQDDPVFTRTINARIVARNAQHKGQIGHVRPIRAIGNQLSPGIFSNHVIHILPGFWHPARSNKHDKTTIA
jgi:hypothetical protein